MKLPRKTKAAILVELNQPLVITEIDLPAKLAVGQVLVQVHYSGICGSQLGEINGVKGDDPYLPHLLGHEASGTVLAIGPGVKHVEPGNKVVLHWRKGLGLESETPAYLWDGRKVNAGWITTFNEYAVVAENRCTAIPDDSNLEVAALFGCAVTTGFGVVENNARVRMGESVVVFGAGGVGLNIVQAAALVSAWPIIAVDQYSNRLELAADMGATHLINSQQEPPREAIQAITGNAGLDVFVDNTGLPEIIELGYAITHSQRRVILVGVPFKGRNINIYSLPLHFGKTIVGSHGGECQPHIDIPRYYRLYRQGRIRLDALITDRFGLMDINAAIAAMRNGTVKGRCLIAMT